MKKSNLPGGMTICEELVRNGLMTQEELHYERSYCHARIPKYIHVGYYILAQPIIWLMGLHPKLLHLVNIISRKVFIDRAIRKGRELNE